VGAGTLAYNTTGNQNTANGYSALIANTVGDFNVAIGADALLTNDLGSSNTAVGYETLDLNTSGFYNTAVGGQSLFGNSTGGNNTAVGYSALSTNTTGSNNTALGNQADVSTGNLSNATVIGYKGYIQNSNQVVLGNASVTSIGGQVGWTNFSDERIKDNVQPNVPGLEFISRLKPVTYHFNVNKENELLGIKDNSDWPGKYNIEKMTFSGFIAQDVDAAAQSIGYDFSGVDKKEKVWGLRYADFVPAMVKSIQELKKQLDEKQQGDAKQQSIILKLQQHIDDLQKEIEELKKK
jgi:hypothetical protein